MAEGIVSLESSIDYVFSGESDATFPRFLHQVMNGDPPAEQVIKGQPCHFLDALPTPKYDEYFAQLEFNVPGIINNDRVWISYETSRGCWWGEKSHCTFCGLNGSGMAFREKSADRVIEEISGIVAKTPTRNIMTTDNIMPNGYFRTLLPRLAQDVPGLNIHYEIKPNLTLEKVMLLHASGIRKIQPGVEALSSSLLKRMGKGVTAAKNIDLLRFCRMLAIDVRWNLLCHFPGDLVSDYEQTLELTGVLTHLEPPQGIVPLSIDRFSPYHSNPGKYGISNMRPAPMYGQFLPDRAKVDKIAYHFDADYQAGSRDAPELIEKISDSVACWTLQWEDEKASRPKLLVQPISDNKFLLIDTRGVTDDDEIEFIDKEQAIAALHIERSTPEDVKRWALDRKCALLLEGKLISLGVCSPEFMLELQARKPRPAALWPAPDKKSETAIGNRSVEL